MHRIFSMRLCVRVSRWFALPSFTHISLSWMFSVKRQLLLKNVWRNCPRTIAQMAVIIEDVMEQWNLIAFLVILRNVCAGQSFAVQVAAYQAIQFCVNCTSIGQDLFMVPRSAPLEHLTHWICHFIPQPETPETPKTSLLALAIYHDICPFLTNSDNTEESFGFDSVFQSVPRIQRWLDF